MSKEKWSESLRLEAEKSLAGLTQMRDGSFASRRDQILRAALDHIAETQRHVGWQEAKARLLDAIEPTADIGGVKFSARVIRVRPEDILAAVREVEYLERRLGEPLPPPDPQLCNHEWLDGNCLKCGISRRGTS